MRLVRFFSVGKWGWLVPRTDRSPQQSNAPGTQIEHPQEIIDSHQVMVDVVDVIKNA